VVLLERYVPTRQWGDILSHGVELDGSLVYVPGTRYFTLHNHGCALFVGDHKDRREVLVVESVVSPVAPLGSRLEY
jgi:hypothetical protein